MNNFFKKSIFLRLSGALFVLLLIVAISYVLITSYAARNYYLETTQKIHGQVAEHLIHEVSPFKDGQVNEEALGTIMHSMMAVNPSIEVYLLDREGKIVSFVVLDKKVRLKTVDLNPVKEAISKKGEVFIQGDDPRNPGEKVIFSAAPVYDNNVISGYVYIVLQSEEYERVTNALFGSYVIRIGTAGFVITLLTTFFFGLLILFFLTKSLRKIQKGVQEFENGNLHSRIEVKSQDEMGQLAMSINSMSNTILMNIEELKQIDGLRRELIANVSHDLRSPMAVIHGYVETYMMKKDALSKEEHEQYLHAILHNTERLNKLVNDLFELSKLEAKQVTLHKEPMMINELLEEICTQFSMLAKKNQIDLITEIPRKMVPIVADSHLIGRAIQNLLDNALKYTQPRGRVQLTASVLGEKLEIVLTNSGTGISAEDIPHVFDRYYKANNASSAQSTGLGLAITKKIIDLHFGEILVMSVPGQQTRFSVFLPIGHQEENIS